MKILTDEIAENFVAINFSEYFKPIREEQNFKKVAELLYIFLTTSAEVEKHAQSNYSNNYVHRYNGEALNIFDPK